MAEYPEPVTRGLWQLLRGSTSRAEQPHGIMAVESGDGSLSWTGAIGAATPDGDPMQAETPFFIASIDKLWNATIAMQLREKGQLDLDASIATYLPPTLTRGLHRRDGIDASHTITVRHLLGHTSGLPDWLEDRPKGGCSLVDRLLTDGDMALEFEDIATLVRDELRPHFAPQDLSSRRPRVRYSDTNYILLMAVIEAVTGEPLEVVHEARLVRPLDLRHTWFAGRSQPLDPVPVASVLRADGRPLDLPLLLRSLRGIYSTTADTVTFLRSLVRGALFQDPATFPSMQARWHRFGVPLDRAALRGPNWPIEYGLGIMRFRLPRLFTPIHPMPAVRGHTGSTGCWLFHCPERDVYLSGSVDEVTAAAVPFRVVPRILEILRPSSQSSDGASGAPSA